MGSSQSRVTRRSAGQLEVSLAGEVTEQAVAEAEADARAQLSVARPGSVAVLVDLSGLATCSLAARDAVVSLQRALGGKVRQTAYVADTAVGRGVSLWVRHTVDDQVIKAVSSRDDAQAWLAAEAGPTTGVRPVVRSRRLTPLKTRKAAG